MQGSAVQRLLAATEGLPCERIFEPSVKLTHTGVASDRGLVSVPRAAVTADRIAQICADLGAVQTPGIIAHLPKAQAVHFGADGEIGKLYLEFAPQDAPEQGLVFIAAKWRGPDAAEDRYHTLTCLSRSEMAEEVAQGLSEPAFHAVMSAVLERARMGDPDGEAVVLKVTQQGSARMSYDVSLADGGQALERYFPILTPLFACLGRSSAELPAQARQALLGHIAMGSAKNGAPFATLYYGAHAV